MSKQLLSGEGTDEFGQFAEIIQGSLDANGRALSDH